MICSGLFIQPPGIIRQIYPEADWRIENTSKEVFLTFDDGPIPEVTPWVIDLLGKYSIRSTFFCVGENVKKFPSVYKLITERGHSAGNHTFNHLNGLKTKNKDYFLNVEKAARYIETDLFRPPHGLLSIGQYKYLKNKYKIIMWDILSRDTHPGITNQEVLKYVISLVRSGSIITFHDSLKSFPVLKIVLPAVIEKLKEDGYSFHPIELKK